VVRLSGEEQTEEFFFLWKRTLFKKTPNFVAIETSISHP